MNFKDFENKLDRLVGRYEKTPSSPFFDDSAIDTSRDYPEYRCKLIYLVRAKEIIKEKSLYKECLK